jgi:acyl-[acyl-carrier-protein]-phospholipid O-acyltransferase/long-chain-fatty-acid--[acyl-carrier-protein] ligase
MLMTTPTFLQLYARKANKEDLSSLRYLVVGAEKLRDGLRKSFEDKFNIEPLEGYGCTELSPVALVNVPNFGEGRDKQKGNKPGSVGRPIPGVSVKIVEPESFHEVDVDKPGLLLVKGPNVMLGYLNDPKKTAEVMRDGYYVTGDIAKLDDDGFVTIQDRLSRFSKIGGEMVPHIRIEDELHEILETQEQVLAVTAVEDEKKGERLVVLTTQQFDISVTLKLLAEKGLPNLWIPKAEDVHTVPALPVLGTGKLDLKGLKEMASSFVWKN